MSEACVSEASDSRLGHTTGAVLCHGASGVDALRLGDHTLAERAAWLIAEICEQVVWVGGAPSGGAPGRGSAPLVACGDEVTAVWAALIAALDAADTDHVLVLSADLPLLTPDLLIGLAGLPDADAAVPRDERGPHVTCARYRRSSVLPLLRAAVEAGETHLEAVLRGLDVCWLEGESLAALDPTGVALSRVADARGLDALVSGRPECMRGAWPGHPGLGLPSSPG